jgi:hypothetical protein
MPCPKEQDDVSLRDPLKEQEPPGWRNLRVELRQQKDPAKFEALLAEIDRLLRAHETLPLGKSRWKKVARNAKNSQHGVQGW